jgi:hypothetical protein
MSEASWSAEQGEFRAHVRAEDAVWASVNPDADMANAHIDTNDALVRKWAEQGVVRDILTPLLIDEPTVRAAAAAYLLYHGATEDALRVLRELDANDGYGRAALNADSALLAWEKPANRST